MQIKFLLLLLLLFACKEVSDVDLSNVEILTINMDNQTKTNETSSFIEKIEVVALETNDSCLIRSYKKLSYCKELDAYIILDKNLIVYVFSGAGKFISSSSLAYGEGPEQYVSIVDFSYNPYTKTIDLLNPHGVIYSYDLDFKLRKKKELKQKDFVFHNLLPIDEDSYLLTRPFITEGEIVVYSVNYAGETNETIKEVYKYTESLAPNHMMREPFFKLDDGFYFSPHCLDYNYYRIDIENKAITPVARLDFGNGNIAKEDLIERFGDPNAKTDTKNEYLRDAKRIKEMHDFLTESEYPLPIVRFLNDKYIYSHIIVNRKPSNFIYNRTTKKSFLQTGKFPIPMPFFVTIQNNILFTLIDPYDMEKYTGEYMSKETLEIVSKLKEDDNPVIMKYYMK